MGDVCLAVDVVEAQPHIGKISNEHDDAEGGVPSHEASGLVKEVGELQASSPHDGKEGETDDLV